jgi:hypothetical protein
MVMETLANPVMREIGPAPSHLNLKFGSLFFGRSV